MAPPFPASDEEDVPVFDPTLKKKKKKKADDETSEDSTNPSNDTDDSEALDFGKKKKKKSNAQSEESETSLEDSEENSALDFGKKKKKKSPTDNQTSSNDSNATDEDNQTSTDFGEKKKRRRKPSESADTQTDDQTDNQDDNEDEDDDSGDNEDSEEGERDYDYDELLNRVFSLLKGDNPDRNTERSKLVIKPPQVFREGTKKTVWANFFEICKMMNRQLEHVLAYALAELGTTGSVDGEHRLIIRGRFNPKQIESVIRHYVGEYVTCRTCHAHDTNLKKENRMYFIQCKACGSTRSVAAIKQGFVAQVGKRKKA